MSNEEYIHWALAVPGGATVLMFVLPNPDKFAEIFTLTQPPRFYVAIYNLIHYAANLSFKGWQTANNGENNGRTDGTN